jgi:putative ABC transport system permease protein
MLFWTTMKLSLKSLLASPMRSILTMLGIIIGVMAVIAMLALVAGVQREIMTRIKALGTNLLVVRPGQNGSRGVASGTQQTLTILDAEAVRDRAASLQYVAPGVSGSVQVKYMNHNTRTRLMGTTSTYLPIRDYAVEKGRVFTDGEVDTMARVAILGPKTATDLFGENEPLGETVKLDGINFKVLGILKAKGDQGPFSSDDQVMIPLSTAMKQVLGLDYLGEIDVQVKEGEDLQKAQGAVTQLLRKRHRLQDDAPDDFNIFNQADMIAKGGEINMFLTVLLGGIASISLLVGGIGIMNIMLVTVTERTREIGIRKAIGAKERSILLQFLVEAVTISGMGGLIGVASGVALAWIVEILIQKFTSSSFTTSVEPISILLALSFSAAVGIFFGFYPAWRASRLDPVEALRYE